jgi:hypothetical protein
MASNCYRSCEQGGWRSVNIVARYIENVGVNAWAGSNLQ